VNELFSIMVREPKEYRDGFDYVKVVSQQRFNIDRRDWTCGANFPLEEGEEAIVARNGRGMQFFFDNGFFEVIDSEPVNNLDLDVEDESGADDAPESDDETDQHTCGECGDTFDTEKGLNSHTRQKHNNKKEEEED